MIFFALHDEWWSATRTLTSEKSVRNYISKILNADEEVDLAEEGKECETLGILDLL